MSSIIWRMNFLSKQKHCRIF
ncbi:protein of unknown function [Stenotrophomonas maltophilia]|nr:protein of unknown function [Stenotrophomonas maltophilia]